MAQALSRLALTKFKRTVAPRLFGTHVLAWARAYNRRSRRDIYENRCLRHAHGCTTAAQSIWPLGPAGIQSMPSGMCR